MGAGCFGQGNEGLGIRKADSERFGMLIGGDEEDSPMEPHH